MKRILFLPLFGLFLTTASLAQPGDRKDKIEAFRIAFFTERLNLTSDEAEKFWPIMNEFRDARQKLNEQYKSDKDIDSMSDAEVEQFILRSVEQDQRELDLKKEYLARFRKVLPARKVARLQGIERDFKEELLKKIQNRERKAGAAPGGPAGPGGRRRNK